MSLASFVSNGAYRVFENNREVLVLEPSGRVTTRYWAPDGRLDVQIQDYPQFMLWLCRPKGTSHGRLTVAIHKLLPTKQAAFRVPSVFTLFVWEDFTHPVLITREPLSKQCLQVVLSMVPPVTAVLNRGRVHIPKGSEKLARGLKSEI